MPNTTPELGLLQGVDADDTADYLTISLANSLSTIDGLFSNVSGHTHGGVHQGGPITNAGVADGSITTAKIADQAVTNAKLAPDTARANVLTNGGFEVWQRGGGPFSQVGNPISADRWQITANGSDTFSVSPSGNYDAAFGGQYAAQVVFTLSGGAGGSAVQQKVEYLPLRGRQLSFSLRVQTNVANAVRAALYDGAAWQYSAFHTGNNQWQTLTVTTTLAASATQALVGAFFAASGTHYLDSAMLVVGSVPANYAPLHPADDLARCLRYYERTIDAAASATDPGIIGQAFSTTQVTFGNLFTVQKAISPSMTIAGSFNAYGATLGGSTPSAGISAVTASIRGARIQMTGASAQLVAGNASLVQGGTGALIAAEANP